ncbi:MAG: hypothetical protein A3J48_03325 [Candidatus Doudnabacteria bacterium RIFCSPHIGHO2_02_FULL_46_11]|uniref:PEP-utilising enzyme mobile domain-containing protein n=1 Tax=Candidatus Doudnabacteria bacterium RIFCSPHIGHO2_02_FULL_46_11 TaxID=1817832 RepID=A0A1F5P7W7_9BACT|nr:MAG: hypothetical protein A3J48_03325 [Candidatus Doudnabacteria bacterium RIFCSPHIGHO2_02_FULL_46_11]
MKIVKGITASSGVAKGSALVIKDPMQATSVSAGNYIVVAPYTTPLLNIILLNAKGIVCETGGMTTHAAIISRELNIPCVMSAQGIMNQVQNGQIVEIKAESGEVIIYDE